MTPRGCQLFHTSNAAEYDRVRPGYPAGMAGHLRVDRGARVLEVGAGTGKLTRQLVADGITVTAVEPDDSMAAILRCIPRVQVESNRVEQLPFADASFDIAIAAQSLHWFANEAAAKELWRVLRPGGQFAVVWNRGSGQQEWLHAVMRLIPKPPESQIPGLTQLDAFLEDRFSVIRRDVILHSHRLSKADVALLFLSNSIPPLSDEARASIGRDITRALEDAPELEQSRTVAIDLATEIVILGRLDVPKLRKESDER